MFDTSGQKDLFFSKIVLYKLICLHSFKTLLFWIRCICMTQLPCAVRLDVFFMLLPLC